MSQKALTALAFIAIGLLAVVIIIGLAQRLLDPTGVAVSLSALVSGIVGGAVLRSRQDKGGGDAP